MKTQCDGCGRKEASMFCYTEKAALCHSCDQSIHRLGKQSGTHQHFQFLYPSSKQVPICDICKDRRAFVFCVEDRAILCGHCDIPIHKANETTQLHNRSLITGAKLSSISSLQCSSSAATPRDCVSTITSKNLVSKLEAKSGPLFTSSEEISNNHLLIKASEASSSATTFSKLPNTDSEGGACKFSLVREENNDSMGRAKKRLRNEGGGLLMDDKGAGDGDCEQISKGNEGSSSSVSEYFKEIVPGWQVQELLDIYCDNPSGISETVDVKRSVFWDDLESYMSFTFPKNA